MSLFSTFADANLASMLLNQEPQSWIYAFLFVFSSSELRSYSTSVNIQKSDKEQNRSADMTMNCDVAAQRISSHTARKHHHHTQLLLM